MSLAAIFSPLLTKYDPDAIDLTEIYQPPTPSWGNILIQGKSFMQFAWWMTLFPGLAIFVTVLDYNLVGEGLLDSLDPMLR